MIIFKNLTKNKFYIVIILFHLLFLPVAINAQCPMCKAALETNKQGSDQTNFAGKGINDGILYLLAMPYLLVGIIGSLWYLNVRKRKIREKKFQFR